MAVDHGAEPSGVDRIARTLRWTALAGWVVLGVWAIGPVVAIAFASLLLAIAARGSAAWLAGRIGLRTGPALTIVVLASFAVFGSTAWWFGPKLVAEAQQLWSQLVAQTQALQGQLQGTAWGRAILKDVAGGRLGSGDVAGNLVSALLSTFGGLGTAALVVFTAIYLAAQPELYRRGALSLLPVAKRPRGHEILDALGDTLRWWLVGRAIDMAFVAVLSYIGLSVLGMPLPLMLALIAGFLTFVPYIGAFAGAAPSVIVGFAKGPLEALWVVLLFVLVQGLEGYVLTPLVQRRTIEMPPALVLLSEIVFGTLLGLPGVVLAPPLAAASLVLVRMAYVEDVLGDRSEETDPAAP